MASRHSYAGASVLQRNDSWASSPWGADEDALFSGGLGGGGTTVVQSSSPMPRGTSDDDEEMGEISDEDMILGNKSFGVQMEEVDEEDMFFGEASYEEWDEERRKKKGVPIRSGDEDGGLGAGDDSFSSSFGVGSWGGAPSFSLKDGLPKRGHARHNSDSSEETGSFLAGLNLPPPKLEKKYRPRDSGVGLSDFDSDLSTASSNGAIAPLPLGGLRGKLKDDGRGGRGRPSFGRSESMANAFASNAAPSMMPMPMPRASTSVSTIASSDQDNDYNDLVTPGFEPSSASGWPNFHGSGPFLPNSNSTTFSSNAFNGNQDPGVVSASNSGNSLEGAIAHGALRMDSEVDAFILRTLLLAQSNKYEHRYNDDHLAGLGDVSMGGGGGPVAPGPGHGGKKPPGTPQKKVKTAFKFGTGGERPWQSAVTNKVVNFEEFVGEKGAGAGADAGAGRGRGGLGGEAVTAAKPGKKKTTKIPRKSLPAAFPMLGGKGKKAQALQLNTKVEDDSDDEGIVVVETSPSEKYEGLGLGRPTAVAGRSWLLRRSSSGALSTFSNGSGGSGEGSSPGTPTMDKSGGAFAFSVGSLSHFSVFTDSCHLWST